MIAMIATTATASTTSKRKAPPPPPPPKRIGANAFVSDSVIYLTSPDSLSSIRLKSIDPDADSKLLLGTARGPFAERRNRGKD